jgi:predicted phage tail protein
MPTVRTTIPSITVFDPKPLYAIAGAGDLAVERFRTLVAEFPTQVQELRKQVEDFPSRAQSLPVELRKTAEDFRKQAEDFPSRAQSLPEELRKTAEELSSKASSAYDDFAIRGEKVVAGLRGEKPGKSVGTKDRATTTRPAAKKTTAKRTTAKRTTAKRTTAKRTTAKKAAARKTPAKTVTASVTATPSQNGSSISGPTHHAPVRALGPSSRSGVLTGCSRTAHDGDCLQVTGAPWSSDRPATAAAGGPVPGP